MPCSRPVWLVAGVWLSMCASTHSQAERAAAALVQRARHAGPGAAGAAMVAADHAGQRAAAPRVGDRRGELAAEPADGVLLAPLPGRRLEDRPRARGHAARGEPLGELRHQHRGRLRAAGVGPAEAPGRADQLDLSLHRYTLYLHPATQVPRTRATPRWSNATWR
jgi:hypothetical protein